MIKYDIPLSRPDLTDADRAAVVDTLDGQRLTNGPALIRLEAEAARATRRPLAVGVSSSGMGMQIALEALDIGPGDEVVVPSFSYAANVNAVLATGATPVFADSDPRTLNMSAVDVECRITPRTRALIGVPVFGNAAGLPELIALCSRFEIPMVENASEAVGSRFRSDVVGKFGRLSVLGFGPNRPIAAGEGGAIVTHDDRLAATCRALRNQGRTDRMSFPEQSLDLGMLMRFAGRGHDARLAEPLAALAASQMRRIDDTRERREQVASWYMQRLAGHAELLLPNIPPDAAICWPLFWVRLSDRYCSDDRDEIVAGLHRHDIGAANHYPCLHLLPHVRQALGTTVGMCPVAESLSERTITLPMFTSMRERQVDQVCQTLMLLVDRMRVTRG
jgi:perosamine synthetase